MSQEQTNWDNPQDHFVWALRNMPMVAGSGGITHPAILRGWSEHLWECGFVHRDHLVSKANEDGHIHVNDLPTQRRRFQPAIMGPRHHYNPAARWVAPTAPDPKPRSIPDIRQFTQHENAAILRQYQEAGMLRELTHNPDFVPAEVTDVQAAT